MREWLVAGAVIEHDDRLLLVRNVRHTGEHDWTPPGGVIEIADGETTLDGLVREVREETGLVVESWNALAYTVTCVAPDLGWRMSAEVHVASSVAGEVVVGDDPDGIVVGADWVTREDHEQRLSSAHPWVREPLLAYLSERWGTPRAFDYVLHGASPDTFRVVRE